MSEDTVRAEKMLRLNAALDDELDAMSMAALERDLGNDPGLRTTFERLKAVRDIVRAEAPREEAPAQLCLAIDRLVQPARPPARRPVWRSAPIVLAASIVLAAAMTASTLTLLLRPDSNSAEEALAAGFMRAEISGGGVDVASSDRHTVKPWLATRAPLGTVAVDLSSAGYPLVGGRVDIVGHAAVPTLVYNGREHQIALSELSSDVVGATVTARSESVSGLAVVVWRDGMRAYVAVSDIAPPDLADFVAKFRAAVAKESEG
jgi:anti-sigma factor RsiW